MHIATFADSLKSSIDDGRPSLNSTRELSRPEIKQPCLSQFHPSALGSQGKAATKILGDNMGFPIGTLRILVALLGFHKELIN